jgi:hypothetical protein
MKTTKRILFAAAVAAVSTVAASAGEWVTLFDGKETKGLRGYKMQEVPKNWTIENGALKTIPGKATDLITAEKYTNFEFQVEWKVAPGGNSGIIYNVAETGGATWSTGPEYQLLDDSRHGDGKNPKTSSGSLYALKAPPKEKKVNPAGEWNSSKIVARNGQIEHWLNGEKVVEYEWASDEVKELVKKSKFANMKDFMSQKGGHIAIQHHGEEAWFRNIRVRRLD